MTYSVTFKTQFAVEFANYPAKQQTAVLTFAQIFQQHGLADFTLYDGKITPSWSGLNPGDADYAYTYGSDLWHYHLGIPYYKQVHGKYKTSDVVLHFQWANRGKHIALVDVYDHYRADGTFYLPPASYLS